jgi:hypothetical protein
MPAMLVVPSRHLPAFFCHFFDLVLFFPLCSFGLGSFRLILRKFSTAASISSEKQYLIVFPWRHGTTVVVFIA